MDTTITVISAIVIAIVSSYVTNWFTRRTRLEAEWRIDKIRHYRELLDSITEVMSLPENFDEVHRRYARVCNAVILIAPQKVTDILFEFYKGQQDRFFKDPDDGLEDNFITDQKILLKRLVLAIRKDMRITPRDDPDTFKFKLRAPTLSESEPPTPSED